MNVTIISETDYLVSNWSGGKTTEVFLYPPTGKYQVGAFDFRISSADVLLEESTFSQLPGYQRVIMSLDKPLLLTHQEKNGRRIQHLAPYEPDFFSGDDETMSVGTCTDFNLIYSPLYKGDMKALSKGECRFILQKTWYFYYALEAVEIELILQNNRQQITLTKKECLMIHDVTEECNIRITESSNDDQPVLIEVTVR
ncbi:MAG: HutD family protein [Vagococcus sp.]